MANRYVAIIDAGSTKSELFIYRYKEVPAVGNPARIAQVEVIESIPCTGCKNPTPIHRQADIGAMSTHLDPLLTAGLNTLCNTHINCEGQERVPVYVLATAGVRSLDTGAEKLVIMRRAWDAIKLFRDDTEARRKVYGSGTANDGTNTIRDTYSFVVPALDEGIYAWIAMNNDKYVTDRKFGITELGGKSMQVAYENPAAAGNDGERWRQVCLFDSKYRVASNSWELGAEVSRNAAVDDALIRLSTRLPIARPVPNPCMPEGHQRKLQAPNPPAPNPSASTPSASNPPAPTPNPLRNSVGTGRFAKCLHLAESRLNAKLGTGSLPHLHSEIFTDRVYAMAGYWYTYDFFSQLDQYKTRDSYDPQRFAEAVRLYCNPRSEWEAPPTPDLHKQCFAAAWMITLFHGDKGFHLLPSAMTRGLIHFPSTPDLRSRSSWTRGAAIMLARHGRPNTFCTPNEFPNILGEPAYNETTALSMSSSPIRDSSIVDTAQPILSPSHPHAVVGSLLPSLPALNAGSTFSGGLACGALLLTLVMIGYRRFSTRHVAVQPVPVSNEKLAIDLDDKPIMVRVRRFFFDKAKGAASLAGEDNISYA